MGGWNSTKWQIRVRTAMTSRNLLVWTLTYYSQEEIMETKRRSIVSAVWWHIRNILQKAFSILMPMRDGRSMDPTEWICAT
ncbi:hypothetical protein COOONC_16091 [Cooperia oncophora]